MKGEIVLVDDGSTDHSWDVIASLKTKCEIKAIRFKRNYGKSAALNTGFQNFIGDNNDIPDGVSYRQTTGSFFKLPIPLINVTGSAYYQFGKVNKNTELSAYQISLEGTYKTNSVLFGLGFELLSGTDQDGESKNKSFTPLYGTNHKFNGWMDYFYVGNHGGSVGLVDLSFTLAYAKDKFSAKLDRKSVV